MAHHRSLNRALLVAGLSITVLIFSRAQAQESHWAAATDATAKTLIDWGRQWAQAACTHNFQGTAVVERRYCAFNSTSTAVANSRVGHSGSRVGASAAHPEHKSSLSGAEEVALAELNPVLS